jgi:hypothetical protein
VCLRCCWGRSPVGLLFDQLWLKFFFAIHNQVNVTFKTFVLDHLFCLFQRVRRNEQSPIRTGYQVCRRPYQGVTSKPQNLLAVSAFVDSFFDCFVCCSFSIPLPVADVYILHHYRVEVQHFVQDYLQLFPINFKQKKGPCGPCWSGCDQLKDWDDKLWRFFSLDVDAVDVTIDRQAAASLVVSFIDTKLPFFLLWYNSVINLGAGEGVNDVAISPSFGVNVHPCLSLFALLVGHCCPCCLVTLRCGLLVIVV